MQCPRDNFTFHATKGKKLYSSRAPSLNARTSRFSVPVGWSWEGKRKRKRKKSGKERERERERKRTSAQLMPASFCIRNRRYYFAFLYVAPVIYIHACVTRRYFIGVTRRRRRASTCSEIFIYPSEESTIASSFFFFFFFDNFLLFFILYSIIIFYDIL